MRRDGLLGVLAAAVWVSGCSGDTAGSGTGGAGTGGTSGAGGTGATSGAGGAGGLASCPTSPPTTGSPCKPPLWGGAVYPFFAHCSWGDDPRPACRTTALCSPDDTWVVTPPNATSCATPPLPAACPATPPTSGGTCNDKALGCWYPDGTRCACSECKGGSAYPVCQTIDPPEWACAAPTAGCPAKIPQAGSSCSEPGASCGPDCDLLVICEDGVWVWKPGDCPICAAPDTRIATPTGERAIAELRVGDLVYSVDGEAVVVVPLARVASTRVSGHRVLRVTLASGAVLEISPGHPTADGRAFADLRPGDTLDQQNGIVSIEVVPYAHARTFDILPSSSTGSYFAAGARVGSSLFGR